MMSAEAGELNQILKKGSCEGDWSKLSRTGGGGSLAQPVRWTVNLCKHVFWRLGGARRAHGKLRLLETGKDEGEEMPDAGHVKSR